MMALDNKNSDKMILITNKSTIKDNKMEQA